MRCADVENIALGRVERKGRQHSHTRAPARHVHTKKPPMNRRPNGESVKRPEPQVGIEPTTARLRIECSTPELLWQRTSMHALARIRTATPFGTTPSRWRVYQFHHQGKTRLSDLTGPTGLEPATSRVTVECSNQTELRPLARIGARWRTAPPPNPISCTNTACHRGYQLKGGLPVMPRNSTAAAECLPAATRF